MADIPADVRALLEGRNFAHLATLLPDGSPHSVAIWIGVEGQRAVFFTQDASRKARNLARDGRVALSAVAHENPFHMIQVRGQVAETLHGDQALEVIDRLSDDYTGKPFPMRSGDVYLVEPERIQEMNLPFEPKQ